MNIHPGKIIFDGEGNTYKVDAQIGRGSFGAVYRIIKENDKKIYALKTLPSDYPDKKQMISLEQEGSVAVKIIHENVIRYFYFHDGEKYSDLPPYIIMEYADSGTLKSFIEQYRKDKNLIELPQLISLLLQLINGMEAINSLLVHRDLKPDNILIKDNVLKISDFGLSKVITEKTRSQSFKGYGHLLYLAPEGWKFQKNTLLMDIYSMGIVFYQLSTLEYPYDLISFEPQEIVNAHLHELPKKPELYNPNLTSTIVQMILKMLKKNPSMRFENWDEIRKCLLSDEIEASPDEDYIQRMIELRIKSDRVEEQQILDKQKRQNEIADHFKIVKSQLVDDIVNPLIDFIETFNKKYISTKEIVYTEKIDSDRIQSGITEYYFKLPSGRSLELELRALIVENFPPQENSKFPTYKNKDIKALGTFRDSTMKKGYNFLLLFEEDNPFGEWIILRNEYRMLTPYYDSREFPEKHAFSIEELFSKSRNLESNSLNPKFHFVPFDIKYFFEIFEENIE